MKHPVSCVLFYYKPIHVGIRVNFCPDGKIDAHKNTAREMNEQQKKIRSKRHSFSSYSSSSLKIAKSSNK